jgi:hypothetical protein
MNKTLLIVISLLISTAWLAGCSETVMVSSQDYLKPVDKNEKIPTLSTPAEVIIPFITNPTWASELSKYVPVYENPEFMPEKDLGKPEIYRNPLNTKATDLNATTYHKADPRAIFDWLEKNFASKGYKLRNSSDGRDSKVYIVVEEHGYYLLTDGTSNMEIQVWKLDGYVGWTKVVYEGTTNKDCGCETKK